MSLYRGILGKDHAIASKPLTKIGAYFIQQRNHAEAMTLLQEALQLYCNFNLPDDLNCAEIHFNMGIVHCETGALERAIDSYEVTLQIRSQILGHESVETAQVSISIKFLPTMFNVIIPLIPNSLKFPPFSRY